MEKIGRDWEEIQADPAFQSLDATQKYNTQLDYFDNTMIGNIHLIHSPLDRH